MKLRPVNDVAGVLCGYAFFCPGCDHVHVFFTAGDPTWNFDGDMLKPTFSPSLKNTTPDHPDPKQRCCHLNLVAGRIVYAADCSHDLANQTADLPDYPY